MLQSAPTNENRHSQSPIPMSHAEERHLNQKQLARRWSLSHRTLERWRCLKQGPAWLKIGGRVLYRVEDIETYERSQIAGHLR